MLALASTCIFNLESKKINYIQQNPVKRGYVYKPEHWRYSSVRDYNSSDGLLKLEIMVRLGADIRSTVGETVKRVKNHR